MEKVKSSIRCKSTFQGDRCRFHVGHIELIADQPDAVAVQHMHAGQFTCWDDEGVKGKAIGAEVRHKRNRQANRVSRILCCDPRAAGLKRVDVLSDLTKLEAFYGGVNRNG